MPSTSTRRCGPSSASSTRCNCVTHVQAACTTAAAARRTTHAKCVPRASVGPRLDCCRERVTVPCERDSEGGSLSRGRTATRKCRPGLLGGAPGVLIALWRRSSRRRGRPREPPCLDRGTARGGGRAHNTPSSEMFSLLVRLCALAPSTLSAPSEFCGALWAFCIRCWGRHAGPGRAAANLLGAPRSGRRRTRPSAISSGPRRRGLPRGRPGPGRPRRRSAGRR